MSIQNKPLQRRGFLRGALATAVLLPLGGALASCAGGGDSGRNVSRCRRRSRSAKNPFGVADSGKLGRRHLQGRLRHRLRRVRRRDRQEELPELEVKINPSTDIAQELQPRFVGGNPPDLIDNSGAKSIGFSTILDQLEDLKSVIEANNLEGTKIADTLFDGVLAPGTFDGKFAAINYVLTVYAMWYSASLFEENGWTVPTTWDEAYDLGVKAKEKGKYLFVWGKEAATYYQTMAIESAIKEGGDEVRLALENLKPDCWSLPGHPERLHRHGEDRQGRLLQARRLRHRVHRRPGTVEQQPGSTALPVRFLDRERDEGPDQG